MRILWCSFCKLMTGLNMGPANERQAHEHHRKYLMSLPETSYPLEPTGDPAEVNEEQRVTPGGFEQR